MDRTFGSYLRNLRKSNGLTLVKLSEMSGVSNPYLSQIENNKFTPSPEILKKLSIPLGVKYETLLNEAGYIEETQLTEVLKSIKEKRGYPLTGKEKVTVQVSSHEGAVFEEDLNEILKSDSSFYKGTPLTKQEAALIDGFIELLIKNRVYDID